ncbi:hypothetical protein SUGI_0086830 [Cryptomeria japonica]|nr:hypothetical protein SUGI_0086830 [Cryptomeria japonica]
MIFVDDPNVEEDIKLLYILLEAYLKVNKIAARDMGSVLCPLLNEMELQELEHLENVKIELLKQDFARKYHEQVAELELVFRPRLYQSHLHVISQHDVCMIYLHLLWLYQSHLHAISQYEVEPTKNMGQKRSRPIDLGSPEQQKRDIADNLDKRKKQKTERGMLSKKLQKDSSKSVDSKLPEGPGWCSVCEVDCNTEKVLKRHILVKKHQSNIKMFKQGSGTRSIGSKLPERPGWCSLCEVDCNTEKDLEQHILAKNHQSMSEKLG